MRLSIFIFCFYWILHSSGCSYPSYVAREVSIQDTVTVTTPSKIQLHSGDLLYFQNGFRLVLDSIYGNYSVNNSSQLLFSKPLPVNDVSVIVNYEDNTGGGRRFAQFYSFVFGAALSSLSIYCVACPKCCFGSCPTVYTTDGKNYSLEAELFSECISRQLEAPDLDMLTQEIPSDGIYTLKITDEALETHYLNEFTLLSAAHPADTKIYPTVHDSFIVVSNSNISYKAADKSGRDISQLLYCDDSEYYRSPAGMLSELKKGVVYDNIQFTVKTGSTGNPLKMIMKYRNTLLSTILLYDVVIGSQGAEAVDWTNKMNTSKEYADIFSLIYKTFSGIKIKYLYNGNWIDAGRFKDSGPLNWKYIAAEIPSVGNEVKIKLEFVPDNFMIDYITFDTTSSTENISFTELSPLSLIDGAGSQRNDMIEYIKSDDEQYLVTNPGDSYILEYKIPARENLRQSLFIKSKGYYNEWVRGKWLTDRQDNYKFNLFDIQGTLTSLANSWEKNREIIEAEFFNARIYLRGAK